jgi:hypothetical protein
MLEREQSERSPEGLQEDRRGNMIANAASLALDLPQSVWK